MSDAFSKNLRPLPPRPAKLFHFRRWISLGLSIAVLLMAGQLIAQNPQLEAERLRQAQNYERMGLYEQAASVYRPLFQQEPRNEIYYEGLRRALVQLRRYDELLAIIDQRAGIVPDIAMRIDRSDVLYKKGERDTALKTWQDLLRQYPAIETFSAVAQALEENQAPDEALQIYQSGREHLRNPALFSLEIAELQAQRMNLAEATAEYVRHVQADPRQFPLVQRRVLEMADEADATAKIVAVLEEMLPAARDRESVHRLLASLFVQDRNFARAFQEYQALDQLTATAGKANAGHEIYNFAEEARRAAALEYAEQAYRLVLGSMEKSPYLFPALFGLGQNAREQGKYSEALNTFEQLIQKNGNNLRNPWVQRALAEQGEIYFESLGDLPNALATYRKIYESNPDPNNKARIDAAFRLGDCYLAQGDTRQALQWYETARKIGSRQPLTQDKVNYALARADFFQGRFRAAMQKLEEIGAQRRPSAANESMVNDALEMLLLLEANFADSAGALLSYARAEFLTMQHNRAAAIDTLTELLKNYPDANLVPQAHYSLGVIYVKTGQYSQAVATFRKILEQYSDSIVSDRAMFSLAEIYAKNLHDYPQAQKLFEQLLQDYPGSLLLEQARRQARALGEKNRSL
jgi:tetratricopeptide (TPR) repeat protein